MSDIPPDDVSFPAKRFGTVGYDRGEVEEFCTKVSLALRRPDQRTVSSAEVAAKRFTAKRFGHGYSMREVDDYLERAEAALRIAARSRGEEPPPAKPQPPPHSHTWWIYAVAALLVVAIVALTVTQL